MPTDEKTKACRQCVLDESVYNAVSIGGDRTVESIVAFLHASWVPAWGPVEKVVTVGSVSKAVVRLKGKGLVEHNDDEGLDGLVTILVRDPKTRLGRMVRTNHKQAELVW